MSSVEGYTTGAHFTKDLWANDWNFAKILSDLILILMIQSRYNFVHATTAKLSWHVQNCDVIWPVDIFTSEQHIFLDNVMNH